MDDALRDRLVADALTDVAAGRTAGMGTLYDLLGSSVYRLAEVVTGDSRAAERSTLETFAEIWGHRPDHRGAESPTAWVLGLACAVACRDRTTVASNRFDREHGRVAAGVAPTGPSGSTRVWGSRQ